MINRYYHRTNNTTATTTKTTKTTSTTSSSTSIPKLKKESTVIHTVIKTRSPVDYYYTNTKLIILPVLQPHLIYSRTFVCVLAILVIHLSLSAVCVQQSDSVLIKLIKILDCQGKCLLCHCCVQRTNVNNSKCTFFVFSRKNKQSKIGATIPLCANNIRRM